MAIIEVHDLTKRFDDAVAVDGLSFELREGKVTGFLGPNGAGKTTTLRMLLGLVAPTSGRATILGRPYAELTDPLTHVGAVLEASGFHPGRRASDHLRVVTATAGIPDERVREVLELVGLTESGRRRVKGFSLGMRQRLALAVALLGNPEVLILDEPSNGLDPEGIQWLRRFLRERADEGCTVVVSSHVLAEVAQTVDDILIIARGRLVANAPLSSLTSWATNTVRIRTPQAEALRDFLFRSGHTAELRDPDVVVAFDTTTEEVGLSAAGWGIVIYEMTAERASLEKTFLQLTTREWRPTMNRLIHSEILTVGSPARRTRRAGVGRTQEVDGKALEVNDLRRAYGERVVLDGLTLRVEPGRMFGFLGPNGAGKTTTMRIVLGIDRPDAGEVRWGGQAVAEETRLGFGYMPEQRGLYPKMRVRDQLVYLAALHGLDDAEARSSANDWLTRLGVADRAGERLDRLSHGNQQRVQLAAAMVHNPALLVLDEPFSGLDPIGVQTMTDVLRERVAEGVCVVSPVTS